MSELLLWAGILNLKSPKAEEPTWQACLIFIIYLRATNQSAAAKRKERLVFSESELSSPSSADGGITSIHLTSQLKAISLLDRFDCNQSLLKVRIFTTLEVVLVLYSRNLPGVQKSQIHLKTVEKIQIKRAPNVDAADVAPAHFSLYFEEIRDHRQYAAPCNCNFVELTKWGAVNLLGSGAEAPTFRCPVNLRTITRRRECRKRGMSEGAAAIAIHLSTIITAADEAFLEMMFTLHVHNTHTRTERMLGHAL